MSETGSKLSGHPLAAAMEDPRIHIGHAAELLLLKTEELGAQLLVRDIALPELDQVTIKAREALMWAQQVAMLMRQINKQDGVGPGGIQVVGAMPPDLEGGGR